MRHAIAFLRWGVWAGMGLLAAGCSHYQLGTEGQLKFSTLYVEPVVNHTQEPQLSAPFSEQIREHFLHNGRVEIVDSPEGADVTLRVVLSQYHRDVAAVREQDSGLASKFQITLTALATLTNNRTQAHYFTDRPVSVKRDVFTDNGNPHSPLVGDQLQAEYNLVPILGDALAESLVHTVTDVW